jgi:uncharacterized membrane protein YoaK (UPF0700 family)
MPEDRWNFTWLSCGLAFVGGYSDAASFILAKTFTGHITGNFVLTAISIAGQDWPTFFRRVLAITLFLTGILLNVTLEQVLARKSSWSLLPTVMGLEIVLISTAYFALTSHLAARLELFVICMSVALGLQNGAWREAGGITVHSTYVTGMVTNLLTTGARRYLSKAVQESSPDPKVSLLCGIWLAFVCGAALGAALVFRFQALGILGAALVLLALLIRQSIKRELGDTASNQRPG